MLDRVSPPASSEAQEVLSVHHLKKSYGPVDALKDVSFSLKAGEIRAMCGENGAGKSTLMKLLMGLSRPDGGVVRINGEACEVAGPRDAQQLGLAMVAQELSLAPHLSIHDNLWLGDTCVPFFHRSAALRAKSRAALQALDVDYDIDAPVGRLSLGARQVVEIARLILRDAKIMILDEPTATLSDIEIERLMETLRNLKARGHSILYVTHRLGEVFEICDSVTVMRNGCDHGTHDVEGMTRQQLIELMLGRKFEQLYPARPEETATDRALVIKNLSVPGSLYDFSIVAPRGKITCLVGQVDSGAMSVTRSIARLAPGASGQAFLDEFTLAISEDPSSRDPSISFVSEDRAGEGLFDRNVLENLVSARMASCAGRWGWLSWGRLRALACELAESVTVDGSRLDAWAFDLSGGNQQKILFARALGCSEPGVLLVNEPTRGVDVGARAEIYRLLQKFCDMQYVVLVSSTDLEEVVGIADSVVTVFRGKLVAQYDRHDIAMSSIVADITHPIESEALAA